MNFAPIGQSGETTCNFAEILTLSTTSTVFGYRWHGVSGGASLLAIGQTDVIEAVFSKVLPSATFSRLRGIVTLIDGDAAHDRWHDAQIVEALCDRADAVLVLPSISHPTSTAAIARQAGNKLLETCGRLGMITTQTVPGRSDLSDRVHPMLRPIVGGADPV